MAEFGISFVGLLILFHFDYIKPLEGKPESERLET